MEHQGDVIASGRDTEIVAWGPGLVWRRPRHPRSLAGEAAVMTWVAAQGYPCPEVVEVVDNGLIMQRIEGVSMLDEVAAHPWRMTRYATLLADLHGWLHHLDAPDERVLDLPRPFGPGPSLLHGDLHPDNVMLTGDGPVVIDWTRAAVGPAGADVATTWLLMGAAEVPGSRLDRAKVAAFRQLFLRAFLAKTDRPAAAGQLAAVRDLRRGDVRLVPSEIEAMSRIVERHGRVDPRQWGR